MIVMNAPPAPARSLWTRTFAWSCALAFLVKLWLTADDRRLALGAPYDEYNFVSHARALLDGKWFGDYSNLTLIKGPFYPLFIAVAADLGLPLRLAENIIYAVACLVVVGALATVVRSGAARITVFVFLLFDPWTYDSNTTRVMRGDVMPALVLMVVALAAYLVIHRDRGPRALAPASVALGVALAALLLTREEGVWIFGFLGVLAVWTVVSPADRSVVALRGRCTPVAIVAAVAVACHVAVSTANLEAYGWFTTVEVTSPEFKAAYGALARIVPQAAQRAGPDARIAVEDSALKAAYAASPAARELAPYMHGATARTAARDSCQQFGVCRGIAPGWFLWVFRDAVAAAGHYSSGAAARQYYVRLAGELDAACDANVLHCVPNAHSLAPRVPLDAIPRILADTFHAGAEVVTFASLAFGDETLPPTPVVNDVFRSVTGDPLTSDPSAADRTLKVALQRGIGRVYQALVPALTLLSVIVSAVRLRRSFAEKRLDAVSLIWIGLAVSFATLLGLLATINDFAFPALATEYMKPLYAVLLFGIVVMLAAEPEYWVAGRLAVARKRVTVPPSVHGASRAFRSIARRPAVWWVAAGCVALFAAWQVYPFAVRSRAPAVLDPQPRMLVRLGKAELAALRVAPMAATVSLDAVQLFDGGRWVTQSPVSVRVRKGSPIQLAGWAADPVTMSQGAGLIAVIDGKQPIDVTPAYGGNRPDVASAYRKPAMRFTGFSVLVPTAKLSGGSHSVRLGIVAGDRKSFYASPSVPFVVE
jgi:hypothetical protein